MDEHIARRPFLDDRSLVQEDDPGGDSPGEGHLVRRDHHCHPLIRQPQHRVQHLTLQLRIERRRRFVEEHDLGLHRERPGDRHPLLLAA
jgi:hypothetical protein